MSARLARISLLSTCLSLLGACELTGGGDDESGMDEVCASGCEKPVQCLVTTVDDPGPEDWEKKDAFCADGIVAVTEYPLVDTAILDACRNKAGLFNDDVHQFKYVNLVCQSPHDGDCPDWSPAASVTRSDGTYEIPGAVVDQLLADPRPLTACDSTRFAPLNDGPGFMVVSASEEDLAYQLGLRSGDEILSFNSLPLDDLRDVFAALIEFREAAERSHELVILRRGETLIFYYEVLP